MIITTSRVVLEKHVYLQGHSISSGLKLDAML